MLAVWPDAKTIAEIDDDYRATALFVVPWVLKELDTWIRSRRPVDVSGQAHQAQEPKISDAVVARALESLTLGVNLGTGLTHPSDKTSAVRMFQVLKQGGHQWSPEEVEAWALAHNWNNRGASELRQVAEGVLAGRRFKVIGRAWRSDVLDLWRREAAEGNSGSS